MARCRLHGILTSVALFAAGAGTLLLTLPSIAGAQDDAAGSAPASVLSPRAVPPDGVHGPGTVGEAAWRALTRGPLPASGADLLAKARANAAREQAERLPRLGPFTPEDLAPLGGAAAGPRAPQTLLNRAGQFDSGTTPSDATGAVGTTRYVQLVNRRFGIHNKTGGLISSGTLFGLTGFASPTRVFDPQVLWDATTQRFYYVTDAVVSSTDNRLAFGFSRTASPNSGTGADWCKYFIWYGSEFPDYPKLGDNAGFFGIGVNVFGPSFLRSDVVTVNKPPAGTNCPSASSFSVQQRAGLRDATGQLVFTPVPSNQIDTAASSYIIARNFSLPSTKLWIFRMNGGVVDAIGKALPTASYAVPPDASQGGLSQLLDTLDARNTQAVYARNPVRGNAFSLWTQHTIGNGALAAIRQYEINPVPAAPFTLRTDLIASSAAHLYNAAISPDRASLTGASGSFGGSFIIGYNASNSASGIRPRIVMGSVVNNAGISFQLVRDAVGPYRDFSCPNAGNTCRWGDYSGASPDPNPGTTSLGKVWLTGQFAGSTSTSTTQANWRTRIWAAQP